VEMVALAEPMKMIPVVAVEAALAEMAETVGMAVAVAVDQALASFVLLLPLFLWMLTPITRWVMGVPEGLAAVPQAKRAGEQTPTAAKRAELEERVSNFRDLFFDLRGN